MAFINLKQSIRNLSRNKIYTVINVTGLGISSAFIILVALYVHHALQMDKYSAKTKNIYRTETTDLFNLTVNDPPKGFFNRLAKSSMERYQVASPLILAGDLKKNFTEIKEVTRFQKAWNPVVRVNNQSFKEDGGKVATVDANFFSFLDLPLTQGNAGKPFENKNSAVITERAAKKYFGATNPVGQTISIKEVKDQLYTISAIAKDFPVNSSIQFEVMTLNEAQPRYEQQMSNGTNSMSHTTLFEVKPGTNVNALSKRLAAFGKVYFKDFVKDMQTFSEQARGVNFQLRTRPFRECHFNASDWPYFTDIKSVYQLLLLALVALGIACLNYVLLSLSRVVARSQEAGIRKTLGGSWKNIIRLFLTETQLLVSLSLLLGFVFAFAALPFFNSLTNVTILHTELFDFNVLLIVVVLSIALTLIAGIYPALKMAGISPLNMLRKYSTCKINPALSKVFITLQYTACIVLIVFAIVIAQQMAHIYNKDLGFDKEQTLLLQNPFRFDDEKTVSLREQLKNYVTAQPSFTNFSGTGSRYGYADNMNGFVINGKREYAIEMSVDYDYFSFHKIPIVKGRALSPDFKIDTSRQNFPAEALDSMSSRTMSNIVVNETLYNLLGKPPLDEINRSMGSIIVGVCKDYYIMGVNRKIDPAYHVCRPKFIGYFLVKIGMEQNIANLLDKLKPEWDKMTGNQPFSFYFMDEDVMKQYESYVRWMKVITSASWLAIFIACLGLFGLSAVTAANKTKEVGIRKVLGADIAQLFYSLNKGTMLMIALSITIAVPIATYISNQWLQDFASRIKLHWSIFVVAGGIGLICAIAAVSFHTVKAAIANPVKSLRTE
jgi:putative ABC transport system permease protein